MGFGDKNCFFKILGFLRKEHLGESFLGSKKNFGCLPGKVFAPLLVACRVSEPGFYFPREFLFSGQDRVPFRKRISRCLGAIFFSLWGEKGAFNRALDMGE